VYGHPIYFLETFIDPERFRGTCYRAANWVLRWQRYRPCSPASSAEHLVSAREPVSYPPQRLITPLTQVNCLFVAPRTIAVTTRYFDLSHLREYV
jgi:hypothetical protein